MPSSHNPTCAGSSRRFVQIITTIAFAGVVASLFVLKKDQPNLRVADERRQLFGPFQDPKSVEPRSEGPSLVSDAQGSLDALLPKTLNVEDKVLCFIHVGKTGGASFRARFLQGPKKMVNHPPSLPSLRTWREIHIENTDDTHHPADCDYFVAWVREPVDRAVSAYNMAFDPAWESECASHRVCRRWRYPALIERKKQLGSFGDLNNLAMQLPTNSEALSSWESIDHVGHDTAWYFTYDKSTGKPTKPGKMAHFGALSYLQDQEFVKKLVFVGANECYNEDVERFATLFNVSHSFMNEHPNVHLRGKYTNAFDSGSLTPEARNILQEYFWHDYCVLRSLSALGLIKCQKLLVHLPNDRCDW